MQRSHSSQRSRLSQSMPLDIHHSSVDQLSRLPVEVLWLHLSSRHLVTLGNKSMMAQRLHHALHNAENSSFVVATSPLPMPTSSTSTAMAPSVLVTIPPPTSSTQPIMSTSAALPTVLSCLQPSLLKLHFCLNCSHSYLCLWPNKSGSLQLL